MSRILTRLLAALAGALALACGEAPPRPIVLVVIDTLRADALPFYGGHPANAPFLAELAERSLVFADAWSTSSWTAPSTASIFTSRYPNQHGVETGLKRLRSSREQAEAPIEVRRLPDDVPTLPELMREAGYSTWGVSGNLNIDALMGFDRGFDHFQMIHYKKRGGDADGLVDRILAWKDAMWAAAPFFLYVHFMDPHAPFQRHAGWSYGPDARLDRSNRNAYDGEIRFVDDQIRRLSAELGLDDAIWIVTSDHGQEFGEHGGFGHGFQLHGELTRVPLLVHLPGDPGAVGRVRGHVSSVDLLPTLRRLAGLPDSPLDVGRPLWGDGGPDPEREVFSMRRRPAGPAGAEHKRSVVRGRYKLIWSGPGDVELYDIESDPGEERDLAPTHPEQVAALRSALDAQAASGGPGGESIRYAPTPETLEALEELGYVEGQSEPGPP